MNTKTLCLLISFTRFSTQQLSNSSIFFILNIPLFPIKKGLDDERDSLRNLKLHVKNVFKIRFQNSHNKNWRKRQQWKERERVQLRICEGKKHKKIDDTHMAEDPEDEQKNRFIKFRLENLSLFLKDLIEAGKGWSEVKLKIIGNFWRWWRWIKVRS